MKRHARNEYMFYGTMISILIILSILYYSLKRENKKVRKKYQETHDRKYISYHIAIQIAIAIIGGLLYWLFLFSRFDIRNMDRR